MRERRWRAFSASWGLGIHQFCDAPHKQQRVHAAEKPGEADRAMGPPLTVLTEGPVRLKYRRLVPSILDRLPDLME